MGFSLDHFFKELFDSLNSEKTDKDKLEELQVLVDKFYIYAKECGKIS